MEKKDYTYTVLFSLAIVMFLLVTLGLFLDHKREMKKLELIEKGIIKDFIWSFEKK